jgi:Leucine-rich repeat (LRR) protein
MMCGNGTSSKERCTQNFIERVNAILKQCGATAVEEFKIKFPFDNMLVGHLNSWVKFAVSSRAKNLAIDLEPEDFRCCKYRHRFPFELFDKRSMSHLETIYLSMVSLKAQPSFTGFPNLKVLDLRVVDVSSNDLQVVLSSCINLERLSIVLCDLCDHITVSLPRLQHLHVSHSDIYKIHFVSKNLRTFVYDGTMEPLDLSESLQLRHADMHFPWLTLEHAITELPRAMPHAENLNLSAYLQLKVCCLGFNFLRNLGHFVAKVTFSIHVLTLLCLHL